jgi:DHA1 family bicyclomycin/chloramphenicol resistance-like MFS transporter
VSATLAKRPPLFVLVAISALQPFALNVLAPATPALARFFATDYGTIQLTLTVYLVAVAVTQLVVGPVSDRIGRRPCILGGLASFVVGSVIGIVATDIATLLLARAVQAMGGGTCFALSRAVVRDTAERDEAASLIGYITMAMVVSPMVAPLVGGYLDLHYGWRSIFVAMLVLAAAVTIAAALLLTETAPKASADAQAGYGAALPVLLASPTFVGYAGALAGSTAAFFVYIAGAPYIVVEVMGRSTYEYGVYSMLVAAGYMAGNFVTGRFGARIGGDRLARVGLSISLVATGLALVLALVMQAAWNPAALFIPMTLNAVGNGLTIPGGTASALSVRPDLAGTAAGLVGAGQLGFGAVGAIAIGYAVASWPPALPLAMLLLVASARLLMGRVAKS